MSWSRVVWALGVAAVATVLGLSVPGLRGVLLWPAAVVSRAVAGSEDSFGGSWFAVFLAIYAQLFFWALVAELVRLLWSRLPRR